MSDPFVNGFPDFDDVSSSYNPRTDSRAMTARVVIHTSGHTVSNVQLTKAADSIASAQGYKKDQYQMKYRVNETHKLIQLNIVAPETPDSYSPRRSRNQKTITFHLGSLFDKYEMLRPGSTVECVATVKTDPNLNKETIIINLGSAKAPRRRNTTKNTPPPVIDDAENDTLDEENA